MDGLDAIQEIRNLIGKPRVSKEALGLLLDKADNEHMSLFTALDDECQRGKEFFKDVIEQQSANVIESQNLLEEQLIDEFKSRLEQYRNGRLHINNVLANFQIILDDNQ